MATLPPKEIKNKITINHPFKLEKKKGKINDKEHSNSQCKLETTTQPLDRVEEEKVSNMYNQQTGRMIEWKTTSIKTVSAKTIDALVFPNSTFNPHSKSRLKKLGSFGLENTR